jgi:hypothetical protein
MQDCGSNYIFDYSYFAEKDGKISFYFAMYLGGLGVYTIA